MSPRLVAAIQHCLPQRLISRCVYRAARCRIRPFKNLLIRWFSRIYGLDLAEADSADPDAYTDFNAFFTRALKPGARPIERDTRLVHSPADGTLTEFGRLETSSLLQAKGMRYTLAALVGEDDSALEPYADGHYATIYLAPHDYHRVHAPHAGRLTYTRYLPGRRFSVNRATASQVRELYCRNERAVLWLDADCGRYAVVLVGALNVSSISTVTRGEITSGPPGSWRESAPPAIEAGEEIGRFNLGSTVVLIFPRGAVEWDAALHDGRKLRMGEPIGTLAQPR